MAKKILVVAEKADVGRKIAAALGKNQRRPDGAIEVAYKGRGYVITWAIGHLLELVEPHVYEERYKSWRLEDLPIIPREFRYRVAKGKGSQFKLIKALVKSSEFESVINACDAGREGEGIFGSIMKHAGNRLPVYRAWFRSLIPSIIRAEFDSPRPGREYERLLDAAISRQRADWLVGINGTRGYTVKSGTLCNVGRVITPTMMLLVKRERSITDFKPSKYWTIEVGFKTEAGNYSGIWINKSKKNDEPGGHQNSDNKKDDKPAASRIPSECQAEKIQERVTGGTGKISEITKETKNDNPFLLFDLSTLQGEANSLFMFTAAKTLGIVQKLYEAQILSYPRTDSQHLGDEHKDEVRKILNALKGNGFAGLDYSKCDVNLPGTRVFNLGKLTDHHALIPTGTILTGGSEDERKIYELVVRRFVAAFNPPYKYLSVVVITKVGEDSFKTTGHTTVDLGWKAIYGFTGKDKPAPVLERNAEAKVGEVDLQKKQTSPSSRHSEKTLLDNMKNIGRHVADKSLKKVLRETAGLGTQSTRHEVIERLKKGEFVSVRGRLLVPTEKAFFLAGVVGDEAVADPAYTALFEQELEEISKGKGSLNAFMQKVQSYTRDMVGRAKNKNIEKQTFGSPKGNGKARGNSSRKMGACPECDVGHITENDKSFHCSQWRKGCKFTFWKSRLSSFKKNFGKAPSSTEMDRLLSGGELILKKFSRNGKTFDAPIRLENSSKRGWGISFVEKTQ